MEGSLVAGHRCESQLKKTYFTVELQGKRIFTIATKHKIDKG